MIRVKAIYCIVENYNTIIRCAEDAAIVVKITDYPQMGVKSKLLLEIKIMLFYAYIVH